MSLRRSFLRWLAAGAAAERRALDFSALAAFTPSVRFGEEGRIENNLGRREAIAIGAHSFIRGRLLTYGHGGAIRIGEWCYVGARAEIWSMASISIGNRVLISHDVNIHDGSGHSLNAAERHAHFRRILEHGHHRDPAALPGLKSAPVIIEDDVWISFGATILKGVRLGAGCVIAAGALVTRDVPPRCLYRCAVSPSITPLEET